MPPSKRKRTTRKFPSADSSLPLDEATMFSSWSDYETLTRDVPRVWWELPLRTADEHTAIESELRDTHTLIEVGAHDESFAERLRAKGKTVHTFDVDPHARVEFHKWEALPPKADAVIAKQVLEHVSPKKIQSELKRFAQRAPQLIFTIPNFWAPAWVFVNDGTHINNASYRTWVYWLKKAGYTHIHAFRLGQGKKIRLASKLNAWMGQSDPCHSLLIHASK